jgi:hypothetical protein
MWYLGGFWLGVAWILYCDLANDQRASGFGVDDALLAMFAMLWPLLLGLLFLLAVIDRLPAPRRGTND